MRAPSFILTTASTRWLVLGVNCAVVPHVALCRCVFGGWKLSTDCVSGTEPSSPALSELRESKKSCSWISTRQVKMPLSVSGFVCSGTFSYASSAFVPSMHLVNRCASGQWNWHLWKPCCIEIFTCRWPSQRTTLCWFTQPSNVYDSNVSVIRRLVHFCTLSLWPAVREPASEEFVQLTTGAAKLATRPQMELVTEKRSAIPIAVL